MSLWLALSSSLFSLGKRSVERFNGIEKKNNEKIMWKRGLEGKRKNYIYIYIDTKRHTSLIEENEVWFRCFLIFQTLLCNLHFHPLDNSIYLPTYSHCIQQNFMFTWMNSKCNAFFFFYIIVGYWNSIRCTRSYIYLFIFGVHSMKYNNRKYCK